MEIDYMRNPGGIDVSGTNYVQKSNRSFGGVDGDGYAGGLAGTTLNKESPGLTKIYPPHIPFQIDPMQVQNDIAMGTWGVSPQTQVMSPFNMYGTQVQPFSWNSFLGSFGGK